MTVTVIDSSNMDAILADAGVEVDTPDEGQTAQDGQQEKSGAKAEGSNKTEPLEEHDENGLTEAERKELTDKMQKAIGKKHRMLKEAEEFAAAQYSEKKLAEQRAAELERELAELREKAAPAQQKQEAAQKPKREDFGSESEYLDASIEWGVQEGLRKRAEQEAREAAERHQAQLIQDAKGRIARAMELVPDFADVTGAVDHEVPPAVAGYMQKSELFAELGYHLAKNPELILSLAKLPPDEQLVKIGKIEGTLTPFGSEAAHDGTKPSNTKSDGQAKPAPSNDTGNLPSKARSSAPVITPLSSAGAAHEKDPKDFNVREAISDFAKRNQVNLNLRKRH